MLGWHREDVLDEKSVQFYHLHENSLHVLFSTQISKGFIQMNIIQWKLQTKFTIQENIKKMCHIIVKRNIDPAVILNVM